MAGTSEQGDPKAIRIWIVGLGTVGRWVAQALGEVRIAGPGAGPHLAGQGVFSDLIRVSQDLARRRT